MSAESQELQEILSKIDVSDIASVEFFPVDGESFRLDTDNIKKLTETLQNTFHALSQQLYAQGEPQAQGQPQGDDASASQHEDVIDGEVKE